MNIAVILPSLKNAAPILVGLNLASGLIHFGHSVTIFYFDKMVELKLPDGCRAERISFFRKINFNDFDIVHSHMMRPDFFVFIHGINFKKVKYIATLHNYVEEELYHYYNKFISLVFSFLWNLAWTRQNKLVVLSKHALDYYNRFSFNKKISYAYNGVSVDIDYSSLDSQIKNEIESLRKKGLFIIGTYCNITKRKGLDQLLQLAKINNEVAIVIIGHGPEKDALIKLAEKFNVLDRCLFYPFLANAHQYNILFDVYSMPSRSEGFGLALVEAALHKKNILCSNIDIFREIFSEKEITYFDVDDIDSLNNAVNGMINGIDKSPFSYLRAMNDYSIYSMTQRYIDIYQEVMESAK